MNHNDQKLKIEQLYGRAYLTESEHGFAEDEIRNFCYNNGIKFMYYRKLKNGHQPMWREFKIEGPLGILKQFDDEFCKIQIKNDTWRRNPRPGPM